MVNVMSTSERFEDASGIGDVFSHDRSQKYTILNKIRSRLMGMDRSQNFISSIYRETLKSMIHIMGGFNYINAKNEVISVVCSHGNPERVIAKIREKSNIILPVITVSQTTTQNDENRQKYTPLLAMNSIWNDKKQRAERTVSFVDRPISILYKVNIWTKYNSDMDQIVEQIRFLFNPSLDIPTKFSTLVKATMTEENNLSDVDLADAADRVLRKEIIIEVQTYVPSPKYLLTPTGEIEEIVMETEVVDAVPVTGTTDLLGEPYSGPGAPPIPGGLTQPPPALPIAVS